ncbi:uncharacterized protein LOC119775542 isoform X2 [Cyprinodon tularosa]|uniref:uncharacterized protein LOC119775542 isoform X2 n=1 Tax=Cyprinodon tularosa TaxID=77115 RepID=UPI0018E20A91|nr:uncharacterized protein LOC119775542 isoform X2 [Cyprinodon tularosa]
MQLQILFHLNLLWLPLSLAEGDKWTITITNNRIPTVKGGTVTINCSFTYPKAQHTSNVTIYWKIWKTEGDAKCDKTDHDKRAFVFHPNHTCVDSKFSNRTKLIGNKTEGNCSLQINNITQNEPQIYLRVWGLSNNYSFIKTNELVSFYIAGVNSSTLNPTYPTTTDITVDVSTTSYLPTMPDDRNQSLYLATLVPIVGLICLAAGGTVAYRKRKRSKKVTREESGYYMNFKQTSSHSPESEPPCQTTNKLPPDPKVIDEPVYINYEISENQMGQQKEHKDNIYGNVDYT